MGPQQPLPVGRHREEAPIVKEIECCYRYAYNYKPCTIDHQWCREERAIEGYQECRNKKSLQSQKNIS